MMRGIALVVEPIEALKGTMPEGRIAIPGNGLFPVEEGRGLS
ncbi:MAG: hypothetical protein ACKVGV_00510 [Sphingomonadales bacterium]|jgi:hypothetical protein